MANTGIKIGAVGVATSLFIGNPLVLGALGYLVGNTIEHGLDHTISQIKSFFNWLTELDKPVHSSAKLARPKTAQEQELEDMLYDKPKPELTESFKHEVGVATQTSPVGGGVGGGTGGRINRSMSAAIAPSPDESAEVSPAQMSLDLATPELPENGTKPKAKDTKEKTPEKTPNEKSPDVKSSPAKSKYYVFKIENPELAKNLAKIDGTEVNLFRQEITVSEKDLGKMSKLEASGAVVLVGTIMRPVPDITTQTATPTTSALSPVEFARMTALRDIMEGFGGSLYIANLKRTVGELSSKTPDINTPELLQTFEHIIDSQSPELIKKCLTRAEYQLVESTHKAIKSGKSPEEVLKSMTPEEQKILGHIVDRVGVHVAKEKELELQQSRTVSRGLSR